MDGDTSEDVDFHFSGAWCDLILRLGAHRHAFRTPGVNDPFAELAEAVATLARPASGPSLRAVLWGDEPGGVFLDFGWAPADHLALVVHAVAIRSWITAPNWMPMRGEAVAGYVAPRRTFAGAFLRGFEAVGAAAGPDGSIAGWPHPFPAGAVGRLRAALG
ncbi:hypothetical protein [Streptomyces sp. TS71-3]|uniref:hypothetical protein n=1 Tax=Streptomyces sp. TS71-3 TaxID=2733862 RepID=UPI001B2B3EC8|nr:hypothetical protein [Streptomyces sp. TS71-3]GHJ37034.1 hypothetical protein Sm713_26430 [Streptomyces sp. TS71-3]